MVCAKDDAEAAISSHTLNVADGRFTLIRGRAVAVALSALAVAGSRLESYL